MQGLKLIMTKKRASVSGTVLVNSFPKSGTHLLYQVVRALPQLNDYETFLASTPSLTMRERSQEQTLKKISNWCPGEIVRGHLYFTPAVESALKQKHCIHLFIYRDPRDVVCSEAYYLANMNRWHRLHKTFRSLEDEGSRIQFAIEGDKQGIAPVPYEDINARFKHYEPWISSPNTVSIRFEDLIGDQRDTTLHSIITKLSDHLPGLNEESHSECMAQIQPEKSHTFRKGGGVSSWQKRFTPQHKKVFKEIAGKLLIDLGYEKDFNW
tara:strand:- start:329 stop:1129 length:801 start_codon:yes stop_codon:yes gene_type:complete